MVSLATERHLEINVEEAVRTASRRKWRKIQNARRVVDLLLDQTRRGNVRVQCHMHRLQIRKQAGEVQGDHPSYDFFQAGRVPVVAGCTFLSTLEVHHYGRRAAYLDRLGSLIRQAQLERTNRKVEPVELYRRPRTVTGGAQEDTCGVAVFVVQFDLLQILINVPRSRGLVSNHTAHPLGIDREVLPSADFYLEEDVEEAVRGGIRRPERRYVQDARADVDRLFDPTHRGQAGIERHVHRPL